MTKTYVHFKKLRHAIVPEESLQPSQNAQLETERKIN